MKRFLISFIIGITLIAAGATLLLFELRDFDLVENPNFHSEYFTLAEDETLEIYMPYVSDTALRNIRLYDDTLDDDEVRIEISDFINYSIRGNKITISDRYYHIQTDDVWDSVKMTFDGLKKHEIYTFNSYYNIYIYTSSANDQVYIYNDVATDR